MLLGSQPSVGLIITAAGKSSRFHTSRNKLLETIEDNPVIIKTCLQFLHREDIKLCIITVPADQQSAFEALLSPLDFPWPIKIIPGGETRFESVKKAFYTLDSCTKVMIHDGARPFVSTVLIDELLRAVTQDDAVIPGLPLVDTIKEVKNGYVKQTHDRDSLIAVQTPQVFTFDALDAAYKTTPLQTPTDEASIIESVNGNVKVIMGDAHNIKITFMDDLS